MKYKKLGKSSLLISEIALGTTNFGTFCNYEESKSIVHKALDLGINTIDTADIYGKCSSSIKKEKFAYNNIDISSEEYIGNIIKNERKNIIICTKFGGHPITGSMPNGGSKSYIISSIESSLKRLQTDYIDLYQIHHFDNTTNLEETLETLDVLTNQGKIRYFGCCNFTSKQVINSETISKKYNLKSFVSCQNELNLLKRDVEKTLFSLLEKNNIGFLSYSPLAKGFLTGKYEQNLSIPKNTRMYNNKRYIDKYMTEKNWVFLKKMKKVCLEHNCNYFDINMNWLLDKKNISSVIIGTRNCQQLEQIIKATKNKISIDILNKIDNFFVEEIFT